jgi:hypothetical protein
MKAPRKSFPNHSEYILIGMVFAIVLSIVAQYLTELATLQTHLDATHQRVIRLVVSSIVIALVLTYANFRFERKTAQVTKAFQADGTIPPEGTASDTDVLSLIREGKAEGAACCYQSLHKGTIEQANLAIGINSQQETNTLILVLVAIGAVLPASIGLVQHDQRGLIVGAIVAACFFILLFYTRHVQRKAEANCKMIEKGIVPLPKSASRPRKD